MADDQRMCNRAITKYDDTDRQEHEKVNRRDRSRSRSPRRDNHNDRGRRKDKGFKWKVKRRDGDEPDSRDGGLRRGYRDHYRQRSRSRSRSRSPRRYSSKKHDEDDGVDKKKHKEKDSEQKSKKLAPVAPTPSQPMILVYVNDRLGTKKAIPCFVTDSIKDFKIIVASLIGRQPHEILIKRQGERPFKDQLTLQDYGVSNNVQLDLEVDTGD